MRGSTLTISVLIFLLHNVACLSPLPARPRSRALLDRRQPYLVPESDLGLKELFARLDDLTPDNDSDDPGSSWIDSARALFRRASRWRRASKLVTSTGYVPPAQGNGSELTMVQGTGGLGEPLNAIVSANSDADVLADQQINGGFRNWLLSINMASECLGQHLGTPQMANLGDGNGYLNETAVIRYDYLDPYLGTCQETIEGGNHFRYWTQNGSDADTGAIFMACSAEMPVAMGHGIIPNGYNLGRDWIVGNATGGQRIPTLNLQNGSSFIGSTALAGYTYQTTVTYVAGLLQNGSQGINHFDTVQVDGRGAVDGLVALLEIHITGRPGGGTNDARRLSPLSRVSALAGLLGLLAVAV